MQGERLAETDKEGMQLKKSSQNDDLIKRLYESAALKLNAKERRQQRISNLMSIADDPSSEAERKEAERTPIFCLTNSVCMSLRMNPPFIGYITMRNMNKLPLSIEAVKQMFGYAFSIFSPEGKLQKTTPHRSRTMRGSWRMN